MGEALEVVQQGGPGPAATAAAAAAAARGKGSKGGKAAADAAIDLTGGPEEGSRGGGSGTKKKQGKRQKTIQEFFGSSSAAPLGLEEDETHADGGQGAGGEAGGPQAVVASVVDRLQEAVMARRLAELQDQQREIEVGGWLDLSMELGGWTMGVLVTMGNERGGLREEGMNERAG